MSINIINHYISQLGEESPDYPSVSASALEMISVMASFSYLSTTGVIAQLKSEGYSESFIMGFVAGCERMARVVENTQLQVHEEVDSIQL